jgi:hypothetical protein
VEEGTSTGSVSVTIKGDNLPEIDEKFVMQVTSVEVISNDSSTKYPPLFGSITLVTVVIEENDNAYGQFDLISDSKIVSYEVLYHTKLFGGSPGHHIKNQKITVLVYHS